MFFKKRENGLKELTHMVKPYGKILKKEIVGKGSAVHLNLSDGWRARITYTPVFGYNIQIWSVAFHTPELFRATVCRLDEIQEALEKLQNPEQFYHDCHGHMFFGGDKDFKNLSLA